MEKIFIVAPGEEITGENLSGLIAPEGMLGRVIHPRKLKSQIISYETKEKTRRVLGVVIINSVETDEILKKIHEAEEEIKRKLVIVLIYDPVLDDKEAIGKLESGTWGSERGTLGINKLFKSPAAPPDIRAYFIDQFTQQQPPATIDAALIGTKDGETGTQPE